MISVCMATYNGENYLEEQLDSILAQLQMDDELIISDDGSTDRTIEILQKYECQDQRIKLFTGPGKGVVANFDYAITQSQGEIIFLADQDDVWLPKKVSTIVHFFQKHSDIDLVLSDLIIVNEQLDVIEESYFDYRYAKIGFLHNIIKNKYIGAGMAFRASLKKEILPIPSRVPMHDMWIGLLAAYKKRSVLLPEKLTLYRRHSNNASEIKTEASFVQQIKWRLSLLSAFFKRIVIKRK